jgi:hypothetical protein
MFKKIFLHALISAALASVAALIYNRIYFFATEADFSTVLTVPKLISLSVIVCMLAAGMNFVLIRLFEKRGEIAFNFLFSIISFAAVMVPISITLPLAVHTPELFPGLAVPMVFFPAMAWYTVNPLFLKRTQLITNKHEKIDR